MPPAISLRLPRRILPSPRTAEVFHSRANRAVQPPGFSCAGDVHARPAESVRTDSASLSLPPGHWPARASHRSPLEWFPLWTLLHSILHNRSVPESRAASETIRELRSTRAAALAVAILPALESRGPRARRLPPDIPTRREASTDR